ncbi:MAG: hypothetical protein GY849_13080 [Deltaproteobacteria bacterium]|nr:hypothetical protein [Deltaproteobacteria bacterium]
MKRTTGYMGGVYFHYNYWCNTNNSREQAFCRNILKKYNHDPVVEYKERGYTFILYKLEKKKGPGHVKARTRRPTTLNSSEDGFS